jgi:hypothetical protein
MLPRSAAGPTLTSSYVSPTRGFNLSSLKRGVSNFSDGWWAPSTPRMRSTHRSALSLHSQSQYVKTASHPPIGSARRLPAHVLCCSRFAWGMLISGIWVRRTIQQRQFTAFSQFNKVSAPALPPPSPDRPATQQNSPALSRHSHQSTTRHRCLDPVANCFRLYPAAPRDLPVFAVPVYYSYCQAAGVF